MRERGRVHGGEQEEQAPLTWDVVEANSYQYVDDCDHHCHEASQGEKALFSELVNEIGWLSFLVEINLLSVKNLL